MSKVSGFDGSKPCHFKCKGTECVHLLGELSKLSVDVAAVQETHFTCAVDCWVLEEVYVVLSAYSSHSSIGVSLLIGCSLNADVNLVLTDYGGWLVVADLAMKSFEFQVVAVCVPNITAETVSFYRWLVPFLEDLKWIVLVGDWNAILDPKIGLEGELEGWEHVKTA